MSSLTFTTDEREFIEDVLARGLSARGAPHWLVARLAIAQSLRLPLPIESTFESLPKGAGHRSQLELEQITGAGKGGEQDYDDSLRLLLTILHDEDLLGDNRRYLDLLQQHIRRGLAHMHAVWLAERSYYEYLLEELYVEVDASALSSNNDGAHSTHLVDAAAVERGLAQLDVTASMASSPVQGPRLSRFNLTLGSIEDYDRLRRGLEDLAFVMGLGMDSISLSRGYGERRVVLDIPRPSATWTDVTWTDVRDALKGRDEALPVCAGVDVLGDPAIFDLAETPHLFVAGATGSGKSVCLTAILLSLVICRRPPEILIVDPKGIDFLDFAAYSLLRGGKIWTDMPEAIETLRSVVSEMEQRQILLREHNVRTIAEAQAAGVPIERLVVVVDELSAFIAGRTGAEEPLVRLAQKARAVGIHLLLATQRPEAATFSGLLRANVPSRIALTVQKAADSRIILDEGGAERLLMRGDMLIKLAGRDVRRAHGVRVTSADVTAALAKRSME